MLIPIQITIYINLLIKDVLVCPMMKMALNVLCSFISIYMIWWAARPGCPAAEGAGPSPG